MTAARGPAFGRRLFAVTLVAGYADGVREHDDPATVTIRDFTFLPARLSIVVGQLVEWINRDDVPHSVVHLAHPHGFKSGVLFQGERFSFRFDRPGQYQYACGVYRHMRGIVLVG